VGYFYQQILPPLEVLDKHLTPEVRPVMQTLASRLSQSVWTTEAIHAVIEQAVTSNGLKFPKIAMPLRVMLTGGAQSPSIDAVMALLGKEETLRRMNGFLN